MIVGPFLLPKQMQIVECREGDDFQNVNDSPWEVKKTPKQLLELTLYVVK